MCGRFTLTQPGEAVAAHFRLEPAPVLRARFNIAPMQPVLAVRARPEGGREAAHFRWGLIPAWARPPVKSSTPLINARAEGLASKPSFREAWRRRRCLVPADGFYEWAEEQGRRRCWQIRRRDQGIFAIAGLWEPWPAALPPVANPPAAEGPKESCTLITTTPNALVAPVHNRMPAVLAPEAYDRWLNAASGASALERLLHPWPADDWERVPVEAPLPKES